MAGGVVLPVAAAFAGLEPGHAGDVAEIGPTRPIEHCLGHRPPFRAVFGTHHPPSVRGEPVHRRAVHHARGRPGVDAEVVPVDEEHEVRQAQSPGCVLGFVGAPGRQPSFTFDDEDLHLFGPRQFQRQRLADGGANPMSRRTGIVLQEQAFSRHLGVTGEAAHVTQLGQHLPGEGELPLLWERITLEAGPFVARSQPFVQHGERGVHERDGMPGGKDEAVREAQPRPAHVPSHRSRKREGQHHVDLGARPPRVPALTVVEGQVDTLVDQVLQHLVAGEVWLRGGKKTPHLGIARGVCPARQGNAFNSNSWRHLKPPATIMTARTRARSYECSPGPRHMMQAPQFPD